MEVKVPGIDNTADVIREVLDEWKAGVDSHDPGRVAAVFSEDAIFQGLHPYSVGRQGVSDYYESQPIGLSVQYRVMQSRRPADEVVFGYLRADFTRPDGVQLPLNLSVLITHNENGWQIAHYQVSAVPADN